MYDCWKAFALGTVDFMGKQPIFCYPCTAIQFSDSVKQSGKNIEGFNAYLANTKPVSGKNTKTYLELLGGDPSKLSSPQDFIIDTTKEQYIFFFARKGITWGQVLSATAVSVGAGAGGGFAIGLAGGPIGAGAGALIGGIGTGVVGVAAKWWDSKDYSPEIIIGDPVKINSLCNVKFKDKADSATKSTDLNDVTPEYTIR